MFNICMNKGFQITFENGWTISVQFGYGNYCENHNKQNPAIGAQCEDAECAIITPSGDLYQHESFDGDTVIGYVSPETVLQLMNWTATQERM